MCDQPDQPEAGYYHKGHYVDPPAAVLIVEENPEVGRILGPDGKLARIVRARPDRRIGIKPNRE